MNIVKKAHTGFQKLFYYNSYFERLFPSVKEQKPGKDLYAEMATFQFLICIFLIFFYTKMDADVTNISESLTYNQFSGQMVIALFIQILVMIIDRYLYKSKTFIAIQEQKGFDLQLQAQRLQGSSQPKQKPEAQGESEERAKSVIEFLNNNNAASGVEYHRDDQIQNDFESTASEKEARRKRIEKTISIERTKITLAIVSKYYL
jgi:hypothetical protein